MKKSPLFLLLTVAAIANLAGMLLAGQPCCPECGCAQCQKVCRLEQSTKKEVKYEYRMACEDVCLPGPSEKCGVECVEDKKALRGFHWETIWNPTCGCIRQKRTLVKVPVVKEVPTFKCVVENVCCQCGHAQIDQQATQEALAGNKAKSTESEFFATGQPEVTTKFTGATVLSTAARDDSRLEQTGSRPSSRRVPNP